MDRDPIFPAVGGESADEPLKNESPGTSRAPGRHARPGGRGDEGSGSWRGAVDPVELAGERPPVAEEDDPGVRLERTLSSDGQEPELADEDAPRAVDEVAGVAPPDEVEQVLVELVELARGRAAQDHEVEVEPLEPEVRCGRTSSWTASATSSKSATKARTIGLSPEIP